MLNRNKDSFKMEYKNKLKSEALLSALAIKLPKMRRPPMTGYKNVRVYRREQQIFTQSIADATTYGLAILPPSLNIIHKHVPLFLPSPSIPSDTARRFTHKRGDPDSRSRRNIKFVT